MKKNKTVIRVICFIAVLVCTFSIVQYPFRVDDYRTYKTVRGFYELEENTLDGVYIGTSNVFTFWQGALGWEKSGIAVYSLATPSMPPAAYKYMVKESMKTQPNALYIINTNTFYKQISVTTDKIHKITDYMPLSLNKLVLIKELVGRMSEDNKTGVLEYLFPIIRFHSSWSDLTANSFKRPYKDYKGSSCYSLFLNNSADISAQNTDTDAMLPLNDEYTNILLDFMNFCKEENVNVLFVTVPQGCTKEDMAARMNYTENLIKENGFNLVSFWRAADEINLDMSSDFYDNKHVNIHGSIKFVNYFSRYLIENYGFEDKRGQEKYASWDTAGKKYLKVITPYVSETELSTITS